MTAIRPRTGRLAGTLAVAVLLCGNAYAADYYVRPSGDDSSDGSAGAPFATIGHIIEDLQAGDTLYVGAGTYHEGEFTPNHNGTSTAPITVRCVPGETVVIDGEYTRWQFLAFWENDHWVVDGFTMRHHRSTGVSARYSGYITVRNCISHGNGSSGIEMNYAEFPHAAYNCHMTVENNVCYENGWQDGWASGIHLNNKDQGAGLTHHIIRDNICYNNFDGSTHDTDGNGIMFDMGDGGTVLIENNLCYNNGDGGIRVMDGVATIVNNTCYRNAWDATIDYQSNEIELVESYDPGACTGSVIRNNIAWARAKREFNGQSWGGPYRATMQSPESVTYENNLIWSDAPGEVSLSAGMVDCVKADPRLEAVAADDTLTTIHGATFLAMDAADYDFHLLADSPAIGAGTTAGAPGVDLDALPRDAAPDIGAYEWRTNETPLVVASIDPPRLGEPLLLAITFGGGVEPYAYQWYRDGQPMAGETGAALTIAAMDAAHAGAYHVVVTDGNGTPFASAVYNVATPVAVPAAGGAALGTLALALAAAAVHRGRHKHKAGPHAIA